jgi:hypothetical protein
MKNILSPLTSLQHSSYAAEETQTPSTSPISFYQQTINPKSPNKFATFIANQNILSVYEPQKQKKTQSPALHSRPNQEDEPSNGQICLFNRNPPMDTGHHARFAQYLASSLSQLDPSLTLSSTLSALSIN